MPAYHSSAQCAGVDRVGNVALLPIKCSIRGPVPSLPRDSKDPDIIDEAIQYFKVYSHFALKYAFKEQLSAGVPYIIETIPNY